MKAIKAILVAAMVVVLSLVAAPAAQARVTAGNISLTVTAKCAALGDSVKSFYVWTPERGKLWGATGGKSSTVNFGTFYKSVSGDTFFNWAVDCKMGPDASRQKRYGGNLFQTAYSYTITSTLSGVSNP